MTSVKPQDCRMEHEEHCSKNETSVERTPFLFRGKVQAESQEVLNTKNLYFSVLKSVLCFSSLSKLIVKNITFSFMTNFQILLTAPF